MVYRAFPFLLVLFMLLSPGGCTPSTHRPGTGAGLDPLVVFLVRHAEKAVESMEYDSQLTEEGYRRAAALARTLADAEIGYVHSSDFIRTRNTAAPVADFFDLELELYDTSLLHDLADTIRARGGRHLVVGHSNTTPILVEILGGEPGVPIVEQIEYDRLYILTIIHDEVNTLLLRYGESSSIAVSSSIASSLLVPQTSGSALN
jgi:broad specificity phosphatase PhoE